MATVRIDDIRDTVLHSKGISHGTVVLLQHDEHTSEWVSICVYSGPATVYSSMTGHLSIFDLKPN